MSCGIGLHGIPPATHDHSWDIRLPLLRSPDCVLRPGQRPETVTAIC